jgi:hypothetical protein
MQVRRTADYSDHAARWSIADHLRTSAATYRPAAKKKTI